MSVSGYLLLQRALCHTCAAACPGLPERVYLPRTCWHALRLPVRLTLTPVLLLYGGSAACLESLDCQVTSSPAVQWQQKTRRRARRDRALAAVSCVCTLDTCECHADVDCPVYSESDHASRGALVWR
jgi:hypothetical protein